MRLNPVHLHAANAPKESRIHHIFQGLNEHKLHCSHPNYQKFTLSTAGYYLPVIVWTSYYKHTNPRISHWQKLLLGELGKIVLS